MGMFNNIRTDVRCPVTGRTSADRRIQIKWQDHNALGLADYKVGDTLEEIEPQFDNAWIRSFYDCEACASDTTLDQVDWRLSRPQGVGRHFAYVEVRNGRVCRVLNEKEFAETGLKDVVKDW